MTASWPVQAFYFFLKENAFKNSAIVIFLKREEYAGTESGS